MALSEQNKRLISATLGWAPNARAYENEDARLFLRELDALLDAARAEQKEAPGEICWRCRGERCIQEGSPEAWNYADCPECNATGRIPPRAEQPVLSREAVIEAIDKHVTVRWKTNPGGGGGWGLTSRSLGEAADAILALASLGGRVEEDGSSRSQPIVSPESDTSETCAICGGSEIVAVGSGQCEDCVCAEGAIALAEGAR